MKKRLSEENYFKNNTMDKSFITCITVLPLCICGINRLFKREGLSQKFIFLIPSFHTKGALKQTEMLSGPTEEPLGRQMHLQKRHLEHSSAPLDVTSEDVSHLGTEAMTENNLHELFV